MALRDTWADQLAQLEAELAEGTDDMGRPLTKSGIEELTDNIFNLRQRLGLPNG